MIRVTSGRFASIVTVALCALLAWAEADAGQVWGVHALTNRIVQVNPESGQIMGGFTPPGGSLQPEQLFGGLTFAERGRVLLYQNPMTNSTDLFRLNPRTGALLSTEFLPATDPPEFRAGLTFHSGAGIGGVDAVYAINDGEPVQRQDGYGNQTLVDHAGDNIAFAGALGGDDNGRHFVAAGNEIVEFHPFYTELTLGSVPLPLGVETVAGLAFDGTSIFLSDTSGRLFTIDPADGDVLRNVAVQGGGSLIGLAATPIPEPSTEVLAAVWCLFALCRRRPLKPV